MLEGTARTPQLNSNCRLQVQKYQTAKNIVGLQYSVLELTGEI